MGVYNNNKDGTRSTIANTIQVVNVPQGRYVTQEELVEAVSPKQDIIQVETLPVADSSKEGKVYQFVGITTANYTNGYFYECVSDGEVVPSYSWVQKNVQPSGGGNEYIVDTTNGSLIANVTSNVERYTLMTGMEDTVGKASPSEADNYSIASGASYMTNPHECGWYEYDETTGIASLTEDTVVNPDTYAERNYWSIIPVDFLSPSASPKSNHWLEVNTENPLTYIYSQDTEVNPSKTYYIRHYCQTYSYKLKPSYIPSQQSEQLDITRLIFEYDENTDKYVISQDNEMHIDKYYFKAQPIALSDISSAMQIDITNMDMQMFEFNDEELYLFPTSDTYYDSTKSYFSIISIGYYLGKNISDYNSYSYGINNVVIENSTAEGYANTSVALSHAEGNRTYSESGSHTEGDSTQALNVSHAEGTETVAIDNSHAEGYKTYAYGIGSHAEGIENYVFGERSHVEGDSNSVFGNYSHAEGYGCIVNSNANYSHAEGSLNNMSGNYAHVEGQSNNVTGDYAHVEGQSNNVTGDYAHAEGHANSVTGSTAHAEGQNTTASGDMSHSQNYNTIAQGMAQTVIGKYNVAQGTYNNILPSDYAFIIGNGTANTRSNALVVKWDGTLVFANGTEVAPSQFAYLATVATPPSNAGTYTLKTTVSAQGEVSYTWVADT